MHPKLIKYQCKNQGRKKHKKHRKITVFGGAKSCQNVVRVIKNQGFADPRKRPDKYQQITKMTPKSIKHLRKNRYKIDVEKRVEKDHQHGRKWEPKGLHKSIKNP